MAASSLDGGNRTVLIIVADVVGPIVFLGRHHHEHGVRGEAELDSPHQGGDVHGDVRGIEHDELPYRTVVDHQGALAMNACQQLMQLSMSVCAADFPVGYVIHEEVA